MYKKVGTISSLAALLLVLAVSTVFGAVPQKINYQGYLTDSSSVPVNGTVDMVFAIYNVSSGGAPLWTETQAAVTVSQGIYSVVLGSGTPINLPFDTAYYLGITIGADSEMTPRQPLTSVGYAFKSETANTAANVSGTVAVANGGTGSTTASGARTSLGAAASGANSDITSLSGLTTPLSVGQGGTGTTTGSITGSAALTFTAGGANTNVNLVPNGSGSVDVASKRITSVATPTGGTDAVNKTYVDGAVSGVSAYKTVQSNGAAQTQRSTVNFKSGTGITVSAADNAGSGSTDVTIASSGVSISPQLVVTTTPANASTGNYVTYTASCSTGKVSGGGCRILRAGGNTFSPDALYPLNATTWACDVYSDVAGDSVQVTAICVP